MRILFSAVSAYGHLYPLMPLAVAARDAGHDVAVAVGEEFHPLLTRLGLTPVAAGGDLRSAFTSIVGTLPDRAAMTPGQTMDFARRVFGEIVPRRIVTDLEPHLKDVDLVVHESGSPGAAIAARRAGVPGICHGFGRVADGRTLLFANEGTTALAAEVGVDLPETPGFGDPYVDICPPSLQGGEFLATARREPLRPVAFADASPLPPGALDGDGPLIYLTMGTAFANPPVLRSAIDALAATGARVLAAAGPMVPIAALGDLPDRVRVEPWLPQAAVLPAAALVVHHGGSGTTLGCLAAGVPQLVLPQGADQFGNAEMVAGAGAGEQLLLGTLDAAAVPDALRDAAARLLAGGAAPGAARVAAEIAEMPTPAELAARLPEFA